MIVRLARSLLVMFGISVLVFLIFFATPGADPAARLAGRGASAEALAAVRHEYGLDRSLPVQYGLLMHRLFIAGDLQSQVNRGQRVVPAVLRAAPVTLSLALGAAVVWLLAGLAIGLVAAAREDSAWDRAVTALGLVGISIPVFWLGEVVNLLTQSRLHDTWAFRWVPPLGYVPLSENPGGWARGLVLPWLTLALLYAGVYGRVLRSSLIEAYRQDYIRTARAKGAGEWRVILKHALRGGLLPVVSFLGPALAGIISGSFVVETIFQIPGIGRSFITSALNRDHSMIMGTVIFFAVLIIAFNLFVDVLQVFLNPRLRFG